MSETTLARSVPHVVCQGGIGGYSAQLRTSSCSPMKCFVLIGYSVEPVRSCVQVSASSVENTCITSSNRLQSMRSFVLGVDWTWNVAPAFLRKGAGKARWGG